MIFNVEPYSEQLVNEILPLLADHYKELADKFYGPLNPDLAIYKTMADMGALRIFTIRSTMGVDGVSVLLGYQIYMLGTHPHSKDSYEATQDILYMVPQLRKGMTGYKFLKWCTEQLVQDSVRVVHQRISARNDFGHLFERMGFELEDLTYSKILQEAV